MVENGNVAIHPNVFKDQCSVIVYTNAKICQMNLYAHIILIVTLGTSTEEDILNSL